MHYVAGPVWPGLCLAEGPAQLAHALSGQPAYGACLASNDASQPQPSVEQASGLPSLPPRAAAGFWRPFPGCKGVVYLARWTLGAKK